MKVLTAILVFLLSATTAAQSSRDVDDVRLPQCEALSDLKEALSRLERMKGFSEGDDYKFLKGSGEKCGRYKVRSRSNYTLHSYHNTSNNIFAIYRITGGKGYEGGKVAGFMANSIYSKEGWRIASGDECVLAAQSDQCLLPRKCRAISNSSYSRKLKLDEFAAPAYCYGVGEAP